MVLTLSTLFERSLDQFAQIGAEEQLFSEPVDHPAIMGAFQGYLAGGDPHPIENTRAARNSIPALPRMVRADSAFESLPPAEQARFLW